MGFKNLQQYAYTVKDKYPESIFKINTAIENRRTQLYKTKDNLIMPSCSKLTASSVNEMLQFQTYHIQKKKKKIPFFLPKNIEELLLWKSASIFFSKKYIRFLILSVLDLNHFVNLTL